MTERLRALNDRYEVEAVLGRGGMATVYRGTDRVLGRAVAIKVLSGRFAGDESFVSRFRREAQAAAGLNHPNIVSVFDTGDQDGRHYIVMEYISGRTLGEVMAREGPLEPERAAGIAEAVCLALAAAHEKGLVHRDVKPGNVMLDDEGRVKVMDFGIARAAADDTLTQTGTILGTAAYLSPEQARGDAVDGRSDVYSLGCVLYEMLTGGTPFIAETPVAMAYKHVHEEPDAPRAHRRDIPERLEAVVRRSMAKDPSARYQSADEMREALAAAVGTGLPEAAATEGIPGRGGDTAVLPVTPAAEPAPPPRERRPWWPAAAAAAAVLLLVGAVVLALVNDEPRRAARRNESPPAETAPAEPLSVEDAYAAVIQTVTDGVSAGEVSARAGEEILKQTDEGVTKYSDGDLTGALEKLDEAREEVADAVEKMEITSEERATAILRALGALQAAMEASPPAPSEETEQEEGGEGEDSGLPPPAKGKGKPKGKGKDKKD